MIKCDRSHFCSPGRCLLGELFPLFVILLSPLELFERILREVRSRYITNIFKVIQHAWNVMELQIRKEETTTTKAGQYIFLKSLLSSGTR